METQTPNKNMSDYEKTREERIKQNLNRMQKLGIFDLSLKLKSVKPVRKHRLSSECKSSVDSPVRVGPPEPVRRSSRLQSTAPVSYIELQPKKEDVSTKRRVNIYTEGSKPEEYTDEHAKLLGSTEMNWTLFVDGYGKDGKRIYDCVKGKTCHQCRQKTLGQRTQCSKCDMVQGQFCGDCLYMRYGENVLEANQNPEWICPPCRGICNCSLCRQARGWAPTGTLYKKITQLGFKSVAHYLVQTRRRQTDTADTEPTTEDDKNMKPSAEDGNDPEPNTGEVKVMKPTNEKVKDIEPLTDGNDPEPNTEEAKIMKPTNEEMKDIEPPTGKVKDTETTAEEVNIMRPTNEEVLLVTPTTEKVENMKQDTEKVEDMETITDEIKESLIPSNDDGRSDSSRNVVVVVKIDDKLENKVGVHFSEKTHGSGEKEPDKNTGDNVIEGKTVKENHATEAANAKDDVVGEKRRRSKRTNMIPCEIGEDSIAGRMRQRRRTCN